MFTSLLRLAIFTLSFLPTFSLRTNLRVAEFVRQAVSEAQPTVAATMKKKLIFTVKIVITSTDYARLCIILHMAKGRDNASNAPV